MSDSARKQPPPAPEIFPADLGARGAGQLATDDRGNVTWQWADDDALQADDTIGAAHRVLALLDPAMQIVEDTGNPRDPVRANAQGLKVGYNPYDSGALGKDSFRKKKDLRLLSKWIETRRKLGLVGKE